MFSSLNVSPATELNGYRVSFIIDALRAVGTSQAMKIEFTNVVSKMLREVAEQFLKDNAEQIKAALTPEVVARAIADAAAARVFNKEK